MSDLEPAMTRLPFQSPLPAPADDHNQAFFERRAYAFPCQTRKSVLYVFAIAGSNPRFSRLRGDRREVRLLQLRHSVTVLSLGRGQAAGDRKDVLGTPRLL
jgi:hypothetical protein